MRISSVSVAASAPDISGNDRPRDLRPLADDGKSRPERRIGIPELRRSFRRFRYLLQHRFAQRLCTPDRRVLGFDPERRRRKRRGRLQIDPPMRDEQSTCPSMKECFRKAGESARAGL